jgi:hypothetical protein
MRRSEVIVAPFPPRCCVLTRGALLAWRSSWGCPVAPVCDTQVVTDRTGDTPRHMAVRKGVAEAEGARKGNCGHRWKKSAGSRGPGRYLSAKRISKCPSQSQHSANSERICRKLAPRQARPRRLGPGLIRPKIPRSGPFDPLDALKRGLLRSIPPRGGNTIPPRGGTR